jgi:polar amino acid transport system substrate-binding protein
VIIRGDSGLNIATALAQGKKIGAQRGTTGAAWVQENLIDNGIAVKLNRYETYPMAVLDLINGNIDAVIQDEPATRSSIAKNPELTIAGIIVTREQFGFLVRENDPEDLLQGINEGFRQLKASGVFDEIVARYLGD